MQNPDGRLLVVSDLPLHGASRDQSLQMSQAIATELEGAGWRAGRYTLAYQSCDDSSASSGTWDAGTCSANASAYATDGGVVGVIGPSNSGCTQVELPVANRASNGPLAMISPANTAVGLTHAGPGTAAGEPARYYPTAKRNYVRLLAADDLQGAAGALLAKRLGAGRLFVLNDGEAYGIGVASAAAGAARKLGLSVVRFAAWDPTATSYATLASQIRAAGANAVYLGGLIGSNGARLIADIRAGAPGLTLIAPAGFTPISSVVKGAGGAAEGLYVSAAGLPLDKLPPAGRRFARKFAQAEGLLSVDPAAVYAAAATDVLLQAITDSNGTRASVAAHLLEVKLDRGVVGAIAFDASGDLVGAPVTFYRVEHGAAATYAVLAPSPSLVVTG